MTRSTMDPRDDEEIDRARAAAMFLMQAAGFGLGEIGVYFRYTPYQAGRIIGDVPESARRVLLRSPELAAWRARRAAIARPEGAKAPRKIGPRPRAMYRARVDGASWDEVAERFGVTKAQAVASVGRLDDRHRRAIEAEARATTHRGGP